MTGVVLLDGETLSLTTLVRLSEPGCRVDLTPDAWDRVAAGRAIIDKACLDGNAYYGLNTEGRFTKRFLCRPGQFC